MALLVFIVQLTFWGNQSATGGRFIAIINLFLVVLALLLNLINFKKVLFFALATGLFFDLYSNLTFGVFLFSHLLTALVLTLLLFNFFTNRSFYSLLLLGIIAVAVYHFFFLFFAGLLYLLNLNSFFIKADYFWGVFGQFISTAILLMIGFLIINKFSRRFKPSFLN